jgi:hypothetical protein
MNQHLDLNAAPTCNHIRGVTSAVMKVQNIADGIFSQLWAARGARMVLFVDYGIHRHDLLKAGE